jgi:hypothetical protein
VVEGLLGCGATLGHPDLVQGSLGFGLLTFGQLVQYVGRLMHPATLRARAAKDLRQRFPEAQGAITDR